MYNVYKCLCTDDSSLSLSSMSKHKLMDSSGMYGNTYTCTVHVHTYIHTYTHAYVYVCV